MKDSHLSLAVTPPLSWTWCLHPALSDLPCGLKIDFQSLWCILAVAGHLTAMRQSHLAGLRLFCQSQSTRPLPRESNAMSKLTRWAHLRLPMGKAEVWASLSEPAQGDTRNFHIGRENVLEILGHPPLLAIRFL